MDPVPDDETLAGDATRILIHDINNLLDVILWKRAGNDARRKAHGTVRQRDLHRLLPKLDSFQEEPQLLDIYLSGWVEQLWQSYLLNVNREPRSRSSGHLTLQEAIAKIVYILCKVRGEKIIVGLLNNEPRYLQPLVERLRMISSAAALEHSAIASWEERYVLFLWISHLLLAPFDLASISKPDASSRDQSTLHLPADLPSIVHLLLPISYRYLTVPTKEQNAAATLLVRLCLRPDMRAAGLLNAVVAHLLTPLEHVSSPFVLHKLLGHLNFLVRLVALGNQQEIGHLLSKVYRVCQSLHDDDVWAPLRTSAVARKLIVKVFRNLTVMALQSDIPGVDFAELLQETIGMLLNTLADSDTPVRMAASKSLSLITMRVDTDMRIDIVDAILEMLKQDVLWDDNRRNLAAVNPLQWHGLTLTLAHLLYQRALSPAILGSVLKALLLALTFEQRSSTGSSVGTNVRDAANFGLWAVARRYTTPELEVLASMDIIAGAPASHRLSAIQTVAIELVQSACLDPAGNVRRGSSAALQELIGRHPNAVECGIALVQVVDYHAVGLRASAMARAAEAAALSDIYRSSLFAALQKWRGLCSPDAESRMCASETIANSGFANNIARINRMLDVLLREVKALSVLNIADRHGFVLAIALLIKKGLAQVLIEPPGYSTEDDIDALRNTALTIMNHPQTVLVIDQQAFQSPLRKPELTTYVTLRIIEAICDGLGRLPDADRFDVDCTHFKRLLGYCFRRTDQINLELIPAVVHAFGRFDPELRNTLADWLEQCSNTAHGTHCSAAIVLALGAIYSRLETDPDLQQEIVLALSSRVTTSIDVQQKVYALRSLKLVMQALRPNTSDDSDTTNQIVEAVINGLNDVTVTERGDVGSLARIEALDMTIYIWPLKSNVSSVTTQTMYAIVVRLSLERLDKVRAAARKSLSLTGTPGSNLSKVGTGHDTVYFRSALDLLCITDNTSLLEAIVEGYCSSAGLGSEALTQASRFALSQWLHDGTKNSIDNMDLFVDLWVNILLRNIHSDRVAHPLLETMAYLCDYGHINQAMIERSSIKWMAFLSAVQKAHYKSGSIPRILACIAIYRAMAEVEVIRDHVIRKLRTMLLHPFPHVRTVTAETSFLVLQNQTFKEVNWTQAISVLKPIVSNMIP